MRSTRIVWSLVLMVLCCAAVAGASPRLYVTHRKSAHVTALDGGSGAILADIPVGQAPESIVTSPTGDRVYVLNRCGRTPASAEGFCGQFGEAGTPGTLSVIDPSTNTVADTIDTIRAANSLVMAPDGKRLYVTSPCAPGNIQPCSVGWISVMDTTTRQEVTTISPNGYPFRPSITDDGRVLAVPIVGLIGLHLIDLTGGNLGGDVPVGDFPVSAATRDLRRIVVVNANSSTVSIVDGTIGQAIATLPIGAGAAASGISLDGERAYIANPYFVGPGTPPATVTVIDLESATVTKTIPVGDGPFALALDAGHVYVAGARVDVIDGATNAVTSSFPLPELATGIAVVDGSGAGCTSDASFDSVACRIEALDALVREQVTDASLRATLVRSLARATRSITRAQDAAEVGAPATSHVALRHAARALRSVRARIRSLVGRRLLSRATRKALLDVADPLDRDVRALVRDAGERP